MINMLGRAAAIYVPAIAVVFSIATPAFAQAPTDAQRSAIRAECRADYEAHCSSIPPGGMASLQCLQQNMSSLSPGCAGAVRAVEPAAEAKPEPKAEPKAEPKTEPKAESAPAKEGAAKPAAAPKAAAAAPARKPSSAQIAAIRSACRSDYQRNCAGVPTGGAPALQCLEKNKSKLSASCDKAVSAAIGGGGAAPAAGGAPGAAAGGDAGVAPAAAPAPALVLRPMLPREEFFVLRSACGIDVRALCGGVPAGGGRIMRCLASQAGSLSPACADVLGQFAAQ